jgi:putative peptidoglycan lipid II flippase
VGGNTLLSRILGFARDLVVARVFGADAGTDAFFVAFKIPNFMRRLFAEGAFSLAFVPVLSEYKASRSRVELKRFLDEVAGTLGATLLILTGFGVWGAPWLVAIFAPGFVLMPERLDLAADLLRLTFPYVMLISLTALAGSILNTYRRFGVPAFTPVLLNLSLIGCALWLSPLMEPPLVALAWGVLIAGVLQLAFQLPFLGRLGLLPRPRLALRDPGVRRIANLMAPALFGVSVTQLNLLLDTWIASFLSAGSISWLYYSDRLMEFPLGVLGAAMATVILPGLSANHARADPAAFSRTLDWALRWVLVLGVPAAVGLLVLAGPMMATLFYSASFDARDVVMGTRSLWAYALGVVAFIGIKVLAPGFYARQDTRTPVRIAVVAMLTNMGLNLALVLPLAHAGLALATTLSACLNAGLLYRVLRREGIYAPGTRLRRMLPRALLASALMGIALWMGTQPLESWLAAGSGERVVRLLLWVGIGAGVYGTLLFAFGLRPRQLGPS